MKEKDNSDYKVINLGNKMIKGLDYRLLNIMSLVNVGVIIIKFSVSTFKVIYANSIFNESIGQNIIGFDQENLHGIVVDRDVLKFGDVIHPPLDEDSPVRDIRIKKKDNTISLFTMKSRSVVIKEIEGLVGTDNQVVEPGEYVQIIATENLLIHRSIRDGDKYPLIEFILTYSENDYHTLRHCDVLDIEKMTELISWEITYANYDAMRRGIVDINYSGTSLIKYSPKQDIINMTHIIMHLVRGDIKTVVSTYGLKDIDGMEVDKKATYSLERFEDFAILIRINIDGFREF